MAGAASKGQKNTTKKLTGKHVLLYLVAFFGVIFGVNFIMAYIALDSFSGLETESPYSRGKAYNQEIAQAKEQAKLGWQSAAVFDGNRVAVTLTDTNGIAVTGYRVSAFLRRPATNKADRDLPLAYRPSGDYVSEPLDHLVKGRWTVQIDVYKAEDRVYRQNHELWYDNSPE